MISIGLVLMVLGGLAVFGLTGRSGRLTRLAALAGELRLFLAALRPEYDLDALAADHTALLDAIDADGPDALREHVADSTARLAARLQD